MVMRYYYGLAVGHTYAHASSIPSQSEPKDDANEEIQEEPVPSSSSVVGPPHAGESDSARSSSESSTVSGSDPWEDEDENSGMDEEAILLMDGEMLDETCY